MPQTFIGIVSNLYATCSTENLIIIILFTADYAKTYISNTTVTFQICYFQILQFHITGTYGDICTFCNDLTAVGNLSGSNFNIQVFCLKITLHFHCAGCNIYGSIFKLCPLRILDLDVPVIFPSDGFYYQCILVFPYAYLVFLISGNFYSQTVSVIFFKGKLIRTEGDIQRRYSADKINLCVAIPFRFHCIDLIPVHIPVFITLCRNHYFIYSLSQTIFSNVQSCNSCSHGCTAYGHACTCHAHHCCKDQCHFGKFSHDQSLPFLLRFNIRLQKSVNLRRISGSIRLASQTRKTSATTAIARSIRPTPVPRSPSEMLEKQAPIPITVTATAAMNNATTTAPIPNTTFIS